MWRYLYLLKLLLAMFIFNSHSLSAISPCNITAISTHSYYLWFCHLSVSLSTQVFTFPFILRLYLCNKMAASQNGKPKDVALRLFYISAPTHFFFRKIIFCQSPTIPVSWSKIERSGVLLLFRRRRRRRHVTSRMRNRFQWKSVKASFFKNSLTLFVTAYSSVANVYLSWTAASLDVETRTLNRFKFLANSFNCFIVWAKSPIKNKMKQVSLMCLVLSSFCCLCLGEQNVRCTEKELEQFSQGSIL